MFLDLPASLHLLAAAQVAIMYLVACITMLPFARPVAVQCCFGIVSVSSGGIQQFAAHAEFQCMHQAFCYHVFCFSSGCPVAVANLWDVTDRDIDRFSQGVLSKWMASGPEEGSSGRQDTVKQIVCVSASIACSRKACRLSSLIGAAPVCYGIPVAISTTGPGAIPAVK